MPPRMQMFIKAKFTFLAMHGRNMKFILITGKAYWLTVIV